MDIKWERWRPYGALVLIMLSAMVLCAVLAGYDPFGYNPYNSYSLQAQAWLNGRLDLGQNYAWLEIATYRGKYYISFPPFPSFVMLPFVLVFGADTPDRLISWALGFVSIVYAFKLAYLYLQDEKKAFLISVLLCLAGNYLMITTASGVWFMAQTMSFTLTLMAFYYGSTDKAADSFLSLFMICCAMGCRPFQIVYVPLILYFVYRKLEKEEGFRWGHYIRKLMIYAAPAILLGCVFLLLNILRFGNPLEFGHNYLPEFLEAEKGQFSFDYLSENIASLWRLPWINEEGILEFPRFNGMNIFLVFPILVTYIVYWLSNWFTTDDNKKRETWKHDRILFLALPVLILIHISALCMHKTMGGFHYGHRYITDVMPCVFLGLLLLIRAKGKQRAFVWNMPLTVFGLLFNIYLTVLFLQEYA